MRRGGCWRAAGPGMDLRRAPLLDVQVAAEPGTGRWLALVRVHHLVLDHTGLELVLAEITALLAGHEDQLPEPLPFRDYRGPGPAGRLRGTSTRSSSPGCWAM